MDWVRLMMGVVLLLTPHGIHAQNNGTVAHTSGPPPNLTTSRPLTTQAPTTKTTTTTTLPPPPTTTMKQEEKSIEFAGQTFVFVPNINDEAQFSMCVRDSSSGPCKQCFKFVKKECEQDQCWKIQGISSKVLNNNEVIGILGGTIGLLVVVLIVTTVAFLYAYFLKYKKSGYVQQANEVRTSSVERRESPQMTAPRRPTMEPLQVCPRVPKRREEPQDDNDGYIMGRDINPIQPWKIAAMEHEGDLHGNVRLTLSEYGM